jgi:hypothetical protein
MALQSRITLSRVLLLNATLCLVLAVAAEWQRVFAEHYVACKLSRLGAFDQFKVALPNAEVIGSPVELVDIGWSLASMSRAPRAATTAWLPRTGANAVLPAGWTVDADGPLRVFQPELSPRTFGFQTSTTDAGRAHSEAIPKQTWLFWVFSGH